MKNYLVCEWAFFISFVKHHCSFCEHWNVLNFLQLWIGKIAIYGKNWQPYLEQPKYLSYFIANWSQVYLFLWRNPQDFSILETKQFILKTHTLDATLCAEQQDVEFSSQFIGQVLKNSCMYCLGCSLQFSLPK